MDFLDLEADFLVFLLLDLTFLDMFFAFLDKNLDRKKHSLFLKKGNFDVFILLA